MAQSEVENGIQQCLQSGDTGRAVTLGLRAYGPEIVGFLVATERDASVGAEVFSQFCEDLWRAIDGFRGESSFRTWAYTLARHAGHRYHRDPYRRRGVALAAHPELAQVAEQVRSSTLTHLKSEVRDAVSRLRDELEPDEQALLVLRVDRKMPWNEVAAILTVANDERPLRQRASACRKRYERIKQKLRALAKREGLLKRRA